MSPSTQEPIDNKGEQLVLIENHTMVFGYIETGAEFSGRLKERERGRGRGREKDEVDDKS